MKFPIIHFKFQITFQITIHTSVGKYVHLTNRPQATKSIDLQISIFVLEFYIGWNVYTVQCVHQKRSQEFLHFVSYTHTHKHPNNFDSNFASSSKNKGKSNGKWIEPKRCIKRAILIFIKFGNVKIHFNRWTTKISKKERRKTTKESAHVEWNCILSQRYRHFRFDLNAHFWTSHETLSRSIYEYKMMVSYR